MIIEYIMFFSKGDGGGAVINYYHVLWGIIVSILENQQASTSIVFTRVRNYIEWIEDKTSKY